MSRAGRAVRRPGVGCALALLALAPAPVPAAAAAALGWLGAEVFVERSGPAEGLREYRLRVAGPGTGASARTVSETAGLPRLRSASALTDALFALTMQEVREDSVDSIADAAFNDGRPIACRCFETGAKWHYVWTRDVSYSADLGLALLAPERTRASLEFKLSGLRAGLPGDGTPTPTVIAQDTGSGGSWPVSTDRVVWLRGAMATLSALDGAPAEAFARRVYAAAAGTLAEDLEFAFDERAGLFRGETSFLDWREQTYPAGTARDTRFIAESFALSTNVLHYALLGDLAQLERRLYGHAVSDALERAARLRAAINRAFWLEDAGLYASYLAPAIRPWPVRSFDLLGEALAIVHGVADARQARAILRSYPRTAAGPPVVFPEQPGVPIYHNRALWPFVTAYALRAAARAQQPGLAAEFTQSLLRGTATALSNMENFEFLTQRTHVEDGALSGPVINSPRQLWSVAALAGTVVDVLFGVRPDGDALRLEPFVPQAVARTLAAPGEVVRLAGLRHRGFELELVLRMPARPAAAAGWLAARRVLLDGRALREPRIPLARLRRDRVNRVELVLQWHGTGGPAPAAIAVRDPAAPDAAESARLYAPAAPPAPAASRGGADVRLAIPAAAEGTTLFLRRNGEWLGSVPAAATYVDRLSEPAASACYVLSARRDTSGLESLPSPERCVAAPSFATTLAAGSAEVQAPAALLGPDPGGVPAYLDWGAPDERLELAFVAPADGLERLRVEYWNAHGPVNTGITAAVKRAVARCGTAQAPQQRGAIVMPHVAPADGPALSTAFVFRVRRGERCQVTLSDGLNMSYLEHFDLYTGGAGGRGGPLNRATLRAFHLELAAQEPRAN